MPATRRSSRAIVSATFRSREMNRRPGQRGLGGGAAEATLHRQPSALARRGAGPASGELRAPGGSPGRAGRGRVCPRAVALGAWIGVGILAPLHQHQQHGAGADTAALVLAAVWILASAGADQTPATAGVAHRPGMRVAMAAVAGVACRVPMQACRSAGVARLAGIVRNCTGRRTVRPAACPCARLPS